MSFGKSDLLHVSRLARLSLAHEEISQLEHDLSRIVAFVAELNEVDVEGVRPMTHAFDYSLPFRDDVPATVLGRECVKSSSGYEDGLVGVPKIIE